jgi:DNA-binding response OmpR family regulator
MAESGRILIVDDEVLFLMSAADRLSKEGYKCATAPDGDTAVELLKQNDYDLVISDINMPGNTNLEFIEKLEQVANGMPVILLTGYPSIDSAIRAVRLPVVAYLLKPVDFNLLLTEIKNGIERFKVYKSVRDARKRLQIWNDELTNLEQSFTVSGQGVSPVPVSDFMALTLQNISGSLNDIRQLSEGLVANTNEQQHVCQVLNCRRATVLTEALHETIDVLEETRSAFKSKKLGLLRRKLEGIVKDWGSI